MVTGPSPLVHSSTGLAPGYAGSSFGYGLGVGVLCAEEGARITTGSMLILTRGVRPGLGAEGNGKAAWFPLL